MMFKYEQGTGKFFNVSGAFIGYGYSGNGPGKNNPSMEAVPDVGPIPRGDYNIGPSHQDGKLGPCVMNLDPVEGTDTFGRSLFRMHGDNSTHTASEGCVVLPPWIRQLVSNSSDRSLRVY